MPLWVRILIVTADPSEVEPAATEHARHVEGLRSEGRLRLAGALGDGDGFLEVFEAPDRLAAETTLRDSPLVARGLVAWTLRPFDER